MTESFLKGILERDSFSMRPHTVEKKDTINQYLLYSEKEQCP